MPRFHGTPNGGVLAPGSSRGGGAPEHVCGKCRTPTGRSAVPCPNDPANSKTAQLKARVAAAQVAGLLPRPPALPPKEYL